MTGLREQRFCAQHEGRMECREVSNALRGFGDPEQGKLLFREFNLDTISKSKLPGVLLFLYFSMNRLWKIEARINDLIQWFQ